MISAYGEDIAYSMCMGCPVPKVAVMSFCHMLKGDEGLNKGNLCLLREIERRQPGILKLTPFKPYHNNEQAQKALEDRRQEILNQERENYETKCYNPGHHGKISIPDKEGEIY